MDGDPPFKRSGWLRSWANRQGLVRSFAVVIRRKRLKRRKLTLRTGGPYLTRATDVQGVNAG